MCEMTMYYGAQKKMDLHRSALKNWANSWIPFFIEIHTNVKVSVSLVLLSVCEFIDHSTFCRFGVEVLEEEMVYSHTHLFGFLQE